MAGASVIDSVIMDDCVIDEGASVCYSILDSEVKIGKGAKVGEKRSEASGIAVIGTGISVPEGFTGADGKMISTVADLTKEA